MEMFVKLPRPLQRESRGTVAAAFGPWLVSLPKCFRLNVYLLVGQLSGRQDGYALGRIAALHLQAQKLRQLTQLIVKENAA